MFVSKRKFLEQQALVEQLTKEVDALWKNYSRLALLCNDLSEYLKTTVQAATNQGKSIELIAGKVAEMLETQNEIISHIMRTEDANNDENIKSTRLH